jgi:hypothetical protein
VTLILGDLVMKYCQLDSLLVWFAFLGFVAIPPKWVENPPSWLGWLGKYSLRIYGLSFLPFRERHSPYCQAASDAFNISITLTQPFRVRRSAKALRVRDSGEPQILG